MINMRKMMSVVLFFTFAFSILLVIPMVGAQFNDVDILVFSSDTDLSVPNRYPVQALDNLGFSYQYVGNDASSFLTFLTTQSWDLVVIDEPGSLSNAWDQLNTYVMDGGCLIYSTYYMSYMDGHPLWAALGVAYVSSFNSPLDVYQWDTAHPIFTTPNALPNPMDGFNDDWGDNGDIVSTVGDGTAIGGSTASPSADILLVVANGGKTVFNGFLLADMDGDADTDGTIDAIELWENEIMFVLQSCAAVGGEILPINALRVIAPYLLILALVVGTTGVLYKKRLP